MQYGLKVLMPIQEGIAVFFDIIRAVNCFVSIGFIFHYYN